MALTRALLAAIPIATVAFIPLDFVVHAEQTFGLTAARVILIVGFGAVAWRYPSMGRRAARVSFVGLSLALSAAMALLCFGTGGVHSPGFGFFWALPLVAGLVFLAEPWCPLLSGISSLPLGAWLLVAGGKSQAELLYWLAVTFVATGIATTASTLYRRLQRLEIEEEKAGERARAHGERLASVGTLAAGMAHEINTPLNCVAVYLELLRERAADAEMREWVGEAETAIARIATLVRELLRFAREEKEPAGADAACNLQQQIEMSLALARAQLVKQSAEVVTDFGETPEVRGTGVRVGQVFLNLVVNAAQAMPRTRGDNRIRIRTQVGPDGRVLTEVRDNGLGIPPHVLPRIFEPFFTTKEEGQGTGLGLSICHRIVQDLGGAIEVDSVVGEGTVFRVFLPRADVPGRQ